MKSILPPLVGVFLLSACGVLTPPKQPTGIVWGVPYTIEIVSPGSLDPYDGFATGYRIRIEANHAGDVFLLAHELVHVWGWHHKRLMSEWRGVPCAVQPASHCNPREAHADAVGLAVLHAGCGAGDLGWPGGIVTGCRLPDPAEVRP